MGKMTQKEFVEAVREAGNIAYSDSIAYQHPGLFQVGERKIKLEKYQISGFLLKLSVVMSFNHYDALTRAVWVATMKGEQNTIAEDRPKWGAVQPSRKKAHRPVLQR